MQVSGLFASCSYLCKLDVIKPALHLCVVLGYPGDQTDV